MRTQASTLQLDVVRVADDLVAYLGSAIRKDLRKEGAVVGISGGIDSSVVAALCVRALGPERVLGLMLPERESSPDSKRMAEQLAAHLGIEFQVEDITPALEGFGCYRRKDAAIRAVFPDLPETYLAKITIASHPLEGNTLPYFRLTVETEDGTRSKRLPLREYLDVVAASNLKQRARMTMLYLHAERLNRAVVGTCNKDEHALGFFVKYGDGGADLYPIAHLFKVQVFQLAEHLGIPEEIVARVPTTDTYSAEVTQTDFFFGMPFEMMDVLWHAMEKSVPAAVAARELDLTEEQVQRVYRDLEQKHRNTAYLRRPPLIPDEGK